MSSTLEALIRDLKTKTRLNVGGESLPDEAIVEQLGELSDPSALPELQEALQRTRRFEAMWRRLDSAVDPTSPGSAGPMLAAMLAQQTARKIEAAIAKCGSRAPATGGRIVDLTTDEYKRAQDNAARSGARVGDMHVGFRVISVKDRALDHLSIVLAENVSATVSAKYVVWTLDRRPGGGYRSGTYVSDRAEAQKAFDSRER